MHRRTYLASAAAAAAGLLAGCSSLFGDSSAGGDPDESDESDDGPEAEPGTDAPPPGDGVPPVLGGDRYAYFVSVLNYAGSEHAVSVRVADGTGTVRFEKAFDQAPGTASEHVTVPGDPARVVVQVDDRDERTLEWPGPERCRDEQNAGYPGLEVRIRSRTGDAADDVALGWSCQAVEPGATPGSA